MTLTNQIAGARPFFSICIPQFNRTSFLIEACKSLSVQSFKQFEVCISDDCSTDGREGDLLAFLRGSGLSFVYSKLERNSRYDANLRNSIALAQGDFCFLLGNDDSLASPKVLEDLHQEIDRCAPVSVVITNYAEHRTGRLFKRMPRAGIVGSGPVIAAQAFRNFSFVSGVLLRAEEAKRFSTSQWDGSEMYQMFIGCRMIAAGGRLLGIEDVCVRKDIVIEGETVDSYSSKPRLSGCSIQERRLPMGEILPLVAAAVGPYQTGEAREQTVVAIARQVLVFTYGFWLVEFRRVQSWRYAVGVYLGLRPRNILRGIDVSRWKRAWIVCLYAMTGLVGLTIPIRLFSAVQKHLYAIAKG
jgi:hypothetical protein